MSHRPVVKALAEWSDPIPTRVAELDALTGGLPHGLVLVCEKAGTGATATEDFVHAVLLGMSPEAAGFGVVPSQLDPSDPLGSTRAHCKRLAAKRPTRRRVVVLYDILFRHDYLVSETAGLIEELRRDFECVVVTVSMNSREGVYGVPVRIAHGASMIVVVQSEADGTVIGNVIVHEDGKSGRFRCPAILPPSLRGCRVVLARGDR